MLDIILLVLTCSCAESIFLLKLYTLHDPLFLLHHFPMIILSDVVPVFGIML